MSPDDRQAWEDDTRVPSDFSGVHPVKLAPDAESSARVVWRDRGEIIEGLIRERDEARATIARVAALPEEWSRRASEMSLIGGESERPLDFSEGHYVGVMKTHRELGQKLLDAIEGVR